MKKIGILLGVLVLLNSCTSQDNKTIEPESQTFCECFEKNSSLEFNERSSLCNPKGDDVVLEMNLVEENLQSCPAFYETVIALQTEQLIKRSQYDLGNSTGQWKKVHQNVIAAEYDSLIVNCDHILNTDSLNTDALFLKGFGYENLGRYDEAINSYKQINQIKNSDQWNFSITIAELKKKKAANKN